MKNYLFTLMLSIVFIGWGCKEAAKDPMLIEAFDIHKESVDIAAETVELWEKLPASDSMRSTFDARLQNWGDNLIEVPGFHYHHDGLGHHHGRPQLELTPEDALLIQKEFRDSILSIRQSILTYQSRQTQQ
ncbi:MAG: hypothetical protein AAFQ02_08015 [Bacteroidota bacterium]